MTDGAGLELDLGVHIGAAVGRAVADALSADRDRERLRRRQLNGQIMPMNVDLQPILLTGGNGTLDQPRLLEPPMGWEWQLDGMGAQGFTAGTIGVFINGAAGLNLFTFTTAGQLYQRHFRYLRYGERLVFVATGITLAASGGFGVWVSGLAYEEQLQGEVLL